MFEYFRDSPGAAVALKFISVGLVLGSLYLWLASQQKIYDAGFSYQNILVTDVRRVPDRSVVTDPALGIRRGNSDFFAYEYTVEYESGNLSTLTLKCCVGIEFRGPARLELRPLKGSDTLAPTAVLPDSRKR